MGLFKNILLGTGAAVVSAAGAQAADLPVVKAAPVEYVRVCDAYGSGFFYIPGTDTCLKIGGRVRADYAFVPAQDIFIPGRSPRVDERTGRFRPGRSSGFRDEAGLHTLGWHVRGRISFDARTQTSWGVVRAVAALRLQRSSGVLSVNFGAASRSTGSTLEAAYIQFAGFTFGAARDNFQFMPGRLFGAGHWGSFGNGAKQIAYTHLFGGGLSATVALQDPLDTSVGTSDFTVCDLGGRFGRCAPFEVFRSPQLNGKIAWRQGWGEVQLSGAVRQINVGSADAEFNQGVNIGPRLDEEETAWAVGAGLKLNLPMLAKGSALWLHAAYADGMTEYTINWGAFKPSAYRRDVGGLQLNPGSYVISGTVAGERGIETVKSWNVAALLDHYWTPQWRSTFMASYGQFDAPAAAKDCAGVGMSTFTNGCFGDGTVWNIGKQLAWLPTRGFLIGVELLYARTDFEAPLDGTGVTFASTGGALDCLARNENVGGASCSEGNLTGRLRIQRDF